MVLVIESNNAEVIAAIAQVAKAMQAICKIEVEDAVVSEEERSRRVKIAQKFKGGLKKYTSSYVANKQDWYLQ
jgi:hypothetical protein